MKIASVCSGVGTCALAAKEVGWEHAFFSDIDPFAVSLLSYRFPGVDVLGDFSKIGVERGPADILVGGTPCQAFSQAGKRLGLDDPRGNLALEYLALAVRLQARWFLWENVPGVLSSNGGRDFGAFLGAMADGGYHAAWRVLDAQHFGVAQRRRRVFVLGYRGDWRPPAAVLFEPYGGTGDSLPGGGERGPAGAGAGGGSEGPRRVYSRTSVIEGNVSPPVDCGWASSGSAQAAITIEPLIHPTILARHDDNGFNLQESVKATGMPRRLTPKECERLQGLPDDWTRVPHGKRAADNCRDALRYHAIGNGWALPNIKWLFRRIDAMDAILREVRPAPPEPHPSAGRAYDIQLPSSVEDPEPESAALLPGVPPPEEPEEAREGPSEPPEAPEAPEEVEAVCGLVEAAPDDDGDACDWTPLSDEDEEPEDPADVEAAAEAYDIPWTYDGPPEDEDEEPREERPGDYLF